LLVLGFVLPTTRKNGDECQAIMTLQLYAAANRFCLVRVLGVGEHLA